MRIKLEYIHPYNYGNLMMMINFVNYFFQIYNSEDIKFYINVKNDNEFERVKRSFDKEAIRRSIYRDSIENSKSSNKIKKVYNLYKKNNKKVNYYNAIIYLGGDCLSEYYSKKEFIRDGIKIFIAARKLPVFLVGQTIGPFTSYRKNLAHIFLKNTFVSTRDEACYLYLRDNINLKNLLNSRDLAFLDLPYKDDEKSIKISLFDRYNLKENEYVTLVLSGLYKSYTPSRNDYIEKCFDIVKVLLNIEEIKNSKIVLLPHVINRDDSDINIINEIEKLVDMEMKERVVLIKTELMAHEARTILGYGLFTVTGRMHAAVSTFQMGKPAISLSYSVKYDGVIGKGLNMNNLVIESAGEEFWKRDDFEDIVKEKVEYLLENYKDIVDNIKVNVKQCKELALLQIKEVSKKLNHQC